jgi:mRNA interferase MazF
LEKFVNGDVVVVPFPFSDLTEAERRPAHVLAELDGDGRILCQIKIDEAPKKMIDILAN